MAALFGSALLAFAVSPPRATVGVSDTEIVLGQTAVFDDPAGAPLAGLGEAGEGVVISQVVPADLMDF